jgi:hypothetical protein
MCGRCAPGSRVPGTQLEAALLLGRWSKNDDLGQEMLHALGNWDCIHNFGRDIAKVKRLKIYGMKVWTEFTAPVAGFCQHDSEPLGFLPAQRFQVRSESG